MSKFNSLNKLLFLFTVTVCYVSCKEEPSINESGTVYLSVSIDENGSRNVIDNSILPAESCIGVTLVNETTDGPYVGQEHINVCAQSNTSENGQKWIMQKNAVLYNENAQAVAYYPYNIEAADYTAIPVEAGTTDYMYSGWVKGLNARNSKAIFTMKHALTSVKIILNKGNYDGDGVINELRIKSESLGTKGILNICNGNLSSVTGEDKFNYLPVSGIINNRGWVIEWLGVPTGKEGYIEIIFTVDGQEYWKRILLDKPFESGEKVIYNFSLSDT